MNGWIAWVAGGVSPWAVEVRSPRGTRGTRGLTPPAKRVMVAALLLLLATVMGQARTQIAGNAEPHETHAAGGPGGPGVTGVSGAADLHPRLQGDAVHAPQYTPISRAEHQAFAEAVDLSTFRKLAVFDERIKIIDTLARERVAAVYGKERYKDVLAEDIEKPAGERGDFVYDPVFTYLDFVLNERYYLDKPVLAVEVLPLRRAMLTAAIDDPAERERMLKLGRISPLLFMSPPVRTAMQSLDHDLRLFQAQNQVHRAWLALDEAEESLKMVSPPPGSDRWLTFSELPDNRLAAAGEVSIDVDLSPAAEAKGMFDQLAVAWRAGDANAVNTLLHQLTTLLPAVHPESYPSPFQRELEAFYNRTGKFTIGYVAYLLGAILMLIAFASGRRWLIVSGVGLLLVGFAIHSAGMLVRGILSGRWPIHNQYESFIAIAWFAVLIGIGLMLVKRQWLFGAASSSVGAAALLFANTVPIPSSGVANVMPILATSRILYVHVNMVLLSYALITLGFVVSLFYLGVHYLRDAGTVRFAAAATGDYDGGSPRRDAVGVGGVHKLLHDLDAAQLIILQLAFWILGVGVVLGAYWADHAWGRWWAWDPKETWALITWIVYLIAIHTRFGVKDRGLTTAWLSVLGFFVMLWCYWGVNLLLAGLHSYA